MVGGEALHRLQEQRLVAESTSRLGVRLRALVEEMDTARIIKVVSLVRVVGVLARVNGHSRSFHDLRLERERHCMLLAVLLNLLLGRFSAVRARLPLGGNFLRRLLVTLVLLLVALILLLLAPDCGLWRKGIVNGGSGDVGLVNNEVSLGLTRGRRTTKLIVWTILGFIAIT
jgi:hypothetical protein